MSNRYSRQELFLKETLPFRKKRALIVGAGALGSALAETLVRAGTGGVTIIDRDYVDWTNLQRQQLYTERDARDQVPKATAAKQRLQSINSEVNIKAVVADAGPEELASLIEEQRPHILLDGTDNFETRFIINDLAQKYRLPWVYGACVGSQGISCVVIPGETPCLACLLAVLPAEGMTCDTVGIIAPAVQMTAAFQGAEALKVLAGRKEEIRRELVSFDLWKNTHSSINISSLKKEDCPSCGRQPSYPYLSAERRTKTAVLCGRDTVQVRPPEGRQFHLNQLASMLEKQGTNVKTNGLLLSAVVSGKRVVLFQDGRMLVHGTKNISDAKKLYQQLLG
ncbi:ThiF family adenylyltransferase [Bacillus thermotolerans]|uniref:Sulfur carrier protein adenylyltransferase ThiF n=1 Tax=Bacillus thermotolerans TaxID=1221996 RepID=A0A0F5IAI8_BACTR|nr:ThiF family adenylyltransferase [Bacillus thermotolerans]KKB42521.1 Sulfur carrier protein adenylyltransferase ThiF [Bacillus thermotolerans]KKB44532.1 Sulfur carrier protein adenylyltransferase ThiF [Bacillus thermotolerans]